MTATFSRSADNAEIRIRFDRDDDLVLAVKQIPGRHWDATHQYWIIPPSEEALEPMKFFAKAAGVELPAALVELLEAKAAEHQQNLHLSAAVEAAPVRALPDHIRKALRPFQHAGVEYILKNRRVLLGDDMGLGKTLQSIAAVEALNAYPVLIITPASLKYNWLREYQKWLPEHAESVLVLNGGKASPKQTKAAHIIIANYEMLKPHQWLWSVPWKAVIVDESHYIKNPKTKRTNFVLDITKDVENVILLSGTPVLNRPIELAPQLSCLRVLETNFGGFWRFAHRYCGATKGEYGWIMDGAENLDELNEKMRRTCYIRRDKKTVLPELPEKLRTIMPVEIDNRTEYNKARAELIDYIREQAKVTKKFTKSLEAEMAGRDDITDPLEYQEHRIRQWRMEKAQRAARAETLVRIETLKQVTARGKHKQVCDWVSDFMQQNPDNKVVIFATHIDVIDELQKELTKQMTPALVINGQTPAKERDRLVEVFQNDKEVRILIANIQAGGVGLTLTAASYVLFIEYGWNPGTMNQAEDRCYRIGQKNIVNVYWMVGHDTLDEYLVDLIEDKRDMTSHVIDGRGDIELVSEHLLKDEPKETE